jgi:hypothetical protein
MYEKSQSIDEACEVFEAIPNTDAVSRNALIAGFTLNELITPTFPMLETTLIKNRITYSCISKAYISMGLYVKVR